MPRQVSRAPILRYGMLHCPHCMAPLSIKEFLPEEYKCVWCGKRIGKIPQRLLAEMAERIPRETVKQWMAEMR